MSRCILMLHVASVRLQQCLHTHMHCTLLRRSTCTCVRVFVSAREHLRLHACFCVHLCTEVSGRKQISVSFCSRNFGMYTSHYQLLSCFHGTRSSMSVSYRSRNRRSWGQWSRPFQRRSDPTSTSKGCSCLKTRRDKGEKTACQHCWCLVCKYYITLLYAGTNFSRL